MLFTQAYAPQSLEHFAGNKEAVARAHQWALSFSLGSGARPLLVHGPPGCGKSALAGALAQQMEWNVVAIAPPNETDTERWEQNLAAAFSGASLFGTSTLVLIEDVDTWAASKARKAITTLIGHLSDVRLPVLLSANDAYDRSLSSLRTHCELLPMKAVNSADILKVLTHIQTSEARRHGARAEEGAGTALPPLSEDELRAIASNANGDLRAAICDMQARNRGSSRERSKAVFEQVRMAFKAPTLAATRNLQVSLAERDTLKLYICENLPAERPDPQARAAGFDRLSRADVFDGRIRTRQYWGYLRYSSDLMLWGVASTRRLGGPAFVPYAFPSYIQRMGATKAKRSLRKALSEHIALRVHVTTDRARDFIPLLQAQGQADAAAAQALALYYQLDEEELAGLLEQAPASARQKSASGTGSGARAKRAKAEEGADPAKPKAARGRPKKSATTKD